MTPLDAREARFREYLTRSEPYVAAVVAAGGEPWHGGDAERRRALFMKRYQRPAPPAGLAVPTTIPTTRESDPLDEPRHPGARF